MTEIDEMMNNLGISLLPVVLSKPLFVFTIKKTKPKKIVLV